MLYVLVGDYKKCIEYIKKKSPNVTYSNDIAKTMQYNRGFLANNMDVYFLYEQCDFKNKNNVCEFLQCVLKLKYNVYCIAETIDKKSSFYRQCKKYIKEYNVKSEEITMQMCIDNPMCLYKVDNVVGMLYKIYYNAKFKHDRTRQKISSECINHILTGTMIATDAIKYYILRTA